MAATASPPRTDMWQTAIAAKPSLILQMRSKPSVDLACMALLKEPTLYSAISYRVNYSTREKETICKTMILHRDAPKVLYESGDLTPQLLEKSLSSHGVTDVIVNLFRTCQFCSCNIRLTVFVCL
jgi:hypothetical protein